jgi:hypothetical protein
MTQSIKLWELTLLTGDQHSIYFLPENEDKEPNLRKIVSNKEMNGGCCPEY